MTAVSPMMSGPQFIQSQSIPLYYQVWGNAGDLSHTLWPIALRTRAIPERLRGVFTTRRYTNTRLPFTFTLKVIQSTCRGDPDLLRDLCSSALSRSALAATIAASPVGTFPVPHGIDCARGTAIISSEGTFPVPLGMDCARG